MKALLVLGLLIVLLATPATAFAWHQRDDQIQAPTRPGEIVQAAQANVALQRSAVPTATPAGGDREEKYCIYPRGGLAPDSGPWPCTQSPHIVGIRKVMTVCEGGHCFEATNFGRSLEVAGTNPPATQQPPQAP
ncbi:MAG: hypothetical protein HY724_09045 [Candidatus Rokubacteria bacterium]|nr:hypothetical protein [Candidatus Rokubacteria bacterium]